MKKVKMTDIINKDDFSIEINSGNTLRFVNVAVIAGITILDRETGYGGRDVESGVRFYSSEFIEKSLKNEANNFWLASERFDITEFDEITYSEAILKIIENSNTCEGKFIDGFNLDDYLFDLELKEVDELAPINQLRRLAGHIEGGSNEIVSIYQDEATKQWHIDAGGYHKFSDTFEGLFK